MITIKLHFENSGEILLRFSYVLSHFVDSSFIHFLCFIERWVFGYEPRYSISCSVSEPIWKHNRFVIKTFLVRFFVVVRVLLVINVPWISFSTQKLR